MKTYILEPTRDDLKYLIQKGSKEILSSLRVAHPKALTTKELIEHTGIAEATVYSSVSSLKKGNYIKEINEGKSGPGRPQQNAINSRTTKYVIEDGNHSVSKKYHYKLSRGNVEYDPEFLKVSETLLDKVDLAPFFDNFLLVTRDIQSLIKDKDDEDFKKWAPFIGKDNLCPNCKVNHEVRDFLRAMLLRLLDKFETDERYASFLTENGQISSSGTGMSPGLQGLYHKLEPKNRQEATKSLVLRVLSIKKDTNNGKYEFYAIDKYKNAICAEIDTTLVTDEIVPDSMVECFTNDMTRIHPTLGIMYIGLSKKENESIKRIADMSTFPKTRDVISDIGSIVYRKREEGEIFNVEGLIIQHKILSNENNSGDEFTSSVLLRDNTGMIPLKLESRFSNKFRKGDKILVVGAEVNQLFGLTAGHYSSVTKTGSVIITDRNSPYQNDVYNKHLQVNSKLSQRMIAVRLIDVILTNSETRAFLSIENESEEDLHIIYSRSNFIAIQNKTQFIAQDVVPSFISFPHIPPGIEEQLVVRFEGVDPTESIVSFRFDIREKYPPEYFKFTVRIPH